MARRSDHQALVKAGGGDTLVTAEHAAASTAHMRRPLDPVEPTSTPAFGSLKRNLRLALLTLLFFGGIPAAVLAMLPIAGAVVSTGVLVVESGNKNVQHPGGGVVREILARDGTAVKAGDPLLVLDTAAAEAQLRALESNIAQQMVRLQRLMAERDGATDIGKMPELDLMLVSEDEVRAIFRSEELQFELRTREREGRRAQLRQQIEQERERRKSEEASLEATRAEIEILRKDLEGVRELRRKRLIGRQRLSDLERNLAQAVARERGSLSTLASVDSKVSELELSILQVDQTLRSSLTDQIPATQSAIANLTQTRIPAIELLTNSTITAPYSGVVQKTTIFNTGAVVTPGTTIMEIVPVNDSLVGEIRLKPEDIDQVYPGQPVAINFSAFDRGTTPQLEGSLISISSDLEEDQRTGVRFYKAQVSASAEELERLNGLILQPGMPIEVFIKTSERTILTFLTKPLADQFNRAFR